MIFKDLFGLIFNYISNNFELVFYAEAAFFIAFVLLIVIVIIRQVFFWIRPAVLFNNVLFYGIIAAEFFMIFSTAYIYWKNYKDPPERYLVPEIISQDTSWVKQDLDLFFVSEKSNLDSINAQGGKSSNIFKADSNIEEYGFSPNGKYLLVSTKTKLFNIELLSKKSELIDSVKGLEANGIEGNSLNGVISGISWSPDSKNFCYEMSRWSKYSSQNGLYVFNLEKKEKKILKNLSNAISFIYWGKDGKDLYYLKKEALDTAFSGYSFDVYVYKIPLETLIPERISEIPFDKSNIPEDGLYLRGIDLFLDGKDLIFGRSVAGDSVISDKGAKIGVDEKDCIFVLKDNWFKKKLFKIRRIPVKDQDFSRYQYGGGELAVKNIRWLPGGKYVIMRHKTAGVLILDPWHGRIGSLKINGTMVGWYNKKFAEYNP